MKSSILERMEEFSSLLESSLILGIFNPHDVTVGSNFHTKICLPHTYTTISNSISSAALAQNSAPFSPPCPSQLDQNPQVPASYHPTPDLLNSDDNALIPTDNDRPLLCANIFFKSIHVDQYYCFFRFRGGGERRRRRKNAKG